jgi:hypothetical protein
VTPIDRFVAAASAWGGGTLETPPFRFAGSRLELNLDTSAMGVARVELLDSSGSPIEGLSIADCDPINGNSLAHVVTWKGKSDIGAVAGRGVRLRIVSRATRLYAFRFAGT